MQTQAANVRKGWKADIKSEPLGTLSLPLVPAPILSEVPWSESPEQ